MNRLLANMKSKIKTIDSSINMVCRLQNGETIEVNGLHKMSFKAKDGIDGEFDKVLCRLFEERDNLQVRVNRMER